MIFPMMHSLSPGAFRLHWWNVHCRELGAIPRTSVRRCFRAAISLVRNIFNGSTRVAVNDFHSIRKAHASIWIIIVCVVRTKFFMEKGFEWGKSILENLWCGLLANFSLHLLVHLVSPPDVSLPVRAMASFDSHCTTCVRYSRTIYFSFSSFSFCWHSHTEAVRLILRCDLSYLALPFRLWLLCGMSYLGLP